MSENVYLGGIGKFASSWANFRQYVINQILTQIIQQLNDKLSSAVCIKLIGSELVRQ